MKATFPSVSIFRRVIAVTLTLFLTITFTSAAFANGDGSGDHGLCEASEWVKYDYSYDSEDEVHVWTRDASSPAATSQFSFTVVETKTGEPDEPMKVSWALTSGPSPTTVWIKASDKTVSFAPTGVVDSWDTQHAISFILFCIGEEQPEPAVTLAKAFFDEPEPDLETEPLAVFQL
ncbi:MAG: hypothetical protein R3320_06770, partial [Nitriliruptorales bacterium]|nr:hypothetical protein [Nitriliruptorales bacterium]